MAERQGFEPWVPGLTGTLAFEASSFNHSDTSPTLCRRYVLWMPLSVIQESRALTFSMISNASAT